MRKQYPFDLIEPKWQRYWLEKKTFRATDPNEAGTDAALRPKLYVLDMFPYPSGAGLHVGHPEGYTATDIYCRYKRMRGFNVLHPMGWDAFGLPAEQYAIETGTHPAITTKKNIDTFRRQIQSLGFSYDWDREVDTTDPEYFKWTQWIFLQLYKKGLAYEAEIPVWWCDGCKAVLANEEVKADGTCERKGHKEVYRRPLRQWILKITAYAERLLKDLELVDWPEAIKDAQRNWIRSEGVIIDFEIADGAAKGEKIQVFTTRPDTVYGATCLVLAPRHDLVDKVTTSQQHSAVETYREKEVNKDESEWVAADKIKTGVFTGGYAFNPVNSEKIPIWIADYVLKDYATGAIMAVPAHDKRDFEFAKKFSLEIRYVVAATHQTTGEVFTREGVAVNSPLIDGLLTSEAKKIITAWLAERGLGKATINYDLRDWLFSRQRYWGEPIPIVHCEKCGTVPVPESELPLRLPEMTDYTPSGNAEPPLAKATDWVNCKCPQCGAPAKRETNTMPQWAGSCWYYLRYIDPKNNWTFCQKTNEKYWMAGDSDTKAGVDLYVGGAEHAVLHLLYSRFWHKVLYDLGHVSTPEPFMKLVNQGMILGEDGQKMSKARGNVINPDAVVAEYGADALRMFEMFMGPLEAVKPWSTRGVEGVYRFLGRVWRLFIDEASDREFEEKLTLGKATPDELLATIRLSPAIVDVAPTAEQSKLLHATIKAVTNDLEALSFNTAIARMMEFVNEAMKWVTKPRAVLEPFVLLLSPYAPHVAEELWLKLGHNTTLAYEPWPSFDESLLVETTVTIVVQINGKVRDKIEVATNLPNAEMEKLALANEKVRAGLEGKQVKKVIVVPNKLVNIAVG